MSISKIFLIVTLLVSPTVFAVSSAINFDTQAQGLLNQHFQKYQEAEYYSGATLSIYIPKQPIQNYFTGKESHVANSREVSAKTLFQIGSITKSFTAAIILQLEKEGKLKLSDTLSQHLTDYPKWKDITIEQMLNMTSCLPNYSDTPLWNTDAYNHPEYIWKNDELINFVYPNKSFTPPLKTGYLYTNTGYVLADMITEKVTQRSFKDELHDRTIKAAKLTNTFYPLPVPKGDEFERLAHSYNYNQYDNPALVGKDMFNSNISWAGAAGAIISTSEDVVKWVKALFIDNDILDKQQKLKLTRMISVTTGKPIKNTSASEPRGFALGVIEAYDKSLGRFWFYEGETLGFRAFYMYVPCNGVIIASIFNSSTNSENDHGSDLMKAAYQLVLKQNPRLICAKNK